MAKKAKEKEEQVTEAVKEPLYTMAAVIGLRADGTVDIQDAKQYFEGNVDQNLDPSKLVAMVADLHKGFEKAAIVAEVKRELAASITGGR